MACRDASTISIILIIIIIRPHHKHAVHKCGLLLQMSHVAWSVFLCVSHTYVLCKNGWTDWDSFGGCLLWVQGTTCARGDTFRIHHGCNFYVYVVFSARPSGAGDGWQSGICHWQEMNVVFCDKDWSPICDSWRTFAVYSTSMFHVDTHVISCNRSALLCLLGVPPTKWQNAYCNGPVGHEVFRESQKRSRENEITWSRAVQYTGYPTSLVTLESHFRSFGWFRA